MTNRLAPDTEPQDGVTDECAFCTHLLLTHNSAADGSPCLAKLCDCSRYTERQARPVPTSGLVGALLTAAAAQTPPATAAVVRPICGQTAELPNGRGILTCAKVPHPGPWHRSGYTSWRYKPVFRSSRPDKKPRNST